MPIRLGTRAEGNAQSVHASVINNDTSILFGRVEAGQGIP
jgi:hypothetical protein